MVTPWQNLKAELEEEAKRIFLTCPDEIKRFHYGLITHSDAGKYALNQYFGHWVHAYAGYYGYSGDMISTIRGMAVDPDFELKHLKKAFVLGSKSSLFLAEYGGQTTLGKYVVKMTDVLNTLETKEEFLDLLNTFSLLVSRLYWWFHWYFPWGVGSAMCQRLSPQDVREIERLSQES